MGELKLLLEKAGFFVIDDSDMRYLLNIKKLCSTKNILFYLVNFKGVKSLRKFYYFFKDFTLTEENIFLFNVYKIFYTGFKGRDFSGGIEVFQKVSEFFNFLKNVTGYKVNKEILVDFFLIIKDEVDLFNSSLWETPKSLINNFGRGIYLKNFYILKEKINHEKIDFKKMVFILQVQKRLLEEKKVSVYDRILVLLSDFNLEKAFIFCEGVVKNEFKK